jgi:hypothetical protein
LLEIVVVDLMFCSGGASIFDDVAEIISIMVILLCNAVLCDVSARIVLG